MKLGLLISGLVEFFGGLILYFYPSALIESEVNALNSIIKMYGLLAIVFGMIMLICYRSYQENQMFKNIFLSNMFFHMIISFYTFGLYRSFILKDPYATIFHVLVFGALFILYLKNIKSGTA